MARRAEVEYQAARATGRFIRISPTKARQVTDLIKGRHVDDARRVLQFTARAATAPVAKVLESAVANAEHNHDLPGDELVVTRTWVDEGPTLRRFRPRALGRATRIRKRTCHISIEVGRVELERPAGPARRRAGSQESGAEARASRAPRRPEGNE